MKKKSLLLFCIFLWLVSSLVSCSNSESPENQDSVIDETSEVLTDSIPETNDSLQGKDSTTDTVPEVRDIEGMILLSGGTVTLGSNDANFKANEKPAMKVSLNYSFYMGIHEVTCGEYAAVAKKAKLKTFGKCQNDSLPITDITYYDAVLYANAKSKLDKRDTAYTYKNATYNNEKHCTFLEGLAVHMDVDAFRLPTEAEWVYAATRAWDTKKSWNSDNSGYKLHNVCSIGADTAGFCDMAGNAMEWVNDWMGAFRDTTVTNYAGAPNGGEQGERVVKGGSYSFSEKQLNPYSRGDVYTVTSSTRAEYVGFRLAFGSIPDALWMGSDGKSQASVITALASNETIKAITGSYNVKLAFRNDVSGNISYIDYQNIPISIQEITDGIDAYHPEISPNGSWVAFCTGMEGISGKSTIYVQSLDEDSTIQVKLNSNSAAIPRWRVLDNGDTVIVYVSDAGNNKDDATFKSTSTWQVKFANGKFGKPKKLFDGAYHGGISEDEELAVTGARLLRARVSGKDKTWYNKEQACNASLAQDGTKRTAFLDFGGKTGREFVGSNYATHQRILIADSNGKLIQTIEAPDGYTFDHTEWATSGTKSVIVATLTNVNGAHEKIALVDPDDNSVTELAEGEELWHPNLWAKKRKTAPPPTPIQEPVDNDTSKTGHNNPTLSSSSSTSSSFDAETTSSSSNEPKEAPYFELDFDSAGVYYTSGGSEKASIMRFKMELLWTYYDSVNTIILGSSRPKNGIAPTMFSDSIKAINMAVSYFSINESYFIYKSYLIPHVKKLKYLIVSLDIDMWWKKYKSTKNFFYKEYKNFPGYIYDSNHKFWIDSIPFGLQEATYDGPGESSKKFNRQTLGFSPFSTGEWEDDPPIYHDSAWHQEDPSLFEASLSYLESIIRDAHEKSIYVIGVIFPQSPAYKNTGSYGAYGLKRSEAPVLIERINHISDTLPNFFMIDENKMGNHDYSEEMARDRDHLATPGAEQLTRRLDSLIRTLNVDFENNNQSSGF